MMSSKPLHLRPMPAFSPQAHAVRRAAAVALRATSAWLMRVEARLCVPPPAPAHEQPPVLEFYAEAGAPEGALYLDGKLVGMVPGVRRL